MSAPIEEMPGLRVVVDAVTYLADVTGEAERPHVFRYEITIANDGKEPVRILARKWIVGDASERRLVVEGDGVVGQTPRLEPGEAFSYHSFHTVPGRGWAEGAYFGRADDGRRVCVRIPRFDLVPG
jgi:ApaG protein